jgi:signal transduction histidine kinase
METERLFCAHLNANIEYERARFLRLYAEKENFAPDDIALIEKSIQDHAESLITRRKLEDQLNQVQKINALGHLAGGIAHDFSNILTVISGYSQMLSGTQDLTEQQRTYLEAISKEVTQGASLTAQMRAFSRRQDMAPAPKVLDLGSLVADLGKMLRPLIRETIKIELPSPSRSFRVKGDSSQLEQVLLNLVLNARDSIVARGKITVKRGED